MDKTGAQFLKPKKEKSKLSLDEAKKLYPEWYQPLLRGDHAAFGIGKAPQGTA